MDLSTSSNTIELQIPSPLTSIYNATIYIPSLAFLVCYEHPKISFAIGMILAYMILSTVLDSVICVFFTAPVHRLPLGIALVLVAAAWYLHRLITEYDNKVLQEVIATAELAAAEQAKLLGYGEESGNEDEDNIEGRDSGVAGKTRERAKTGGLDTDVWQGGQRLKRRGWTPDSA